MTREELEKIFEETESDLSNYNKKDLDYECLTILRNAVPLDEARALITGAGYEIVYSIDVDIAAKYLTEEQAKQISLNNWFITEYDTLAFFV